MSVLELLEKGGVLMIPIGVLSLVAATLIVERLWVLRLERVARLEVHQRVLKQLRRGDFETAEHLCVQEETALCRITQVALRNRHRGRAELRESVENAGSLELPWMTRFVDGIGTVATVAPLLGLLGTVTGMIKVFRDFEAAAGGPEGYASMGQLAGGIWEALITTGAGLTVAIPAYLAYRWIDGLVERRVQVLQECSSEIIDELTDDVGAEE
ncbi:MAG: biopolymer transporter ExbB [Myxococcales bacterium]|nr:biopolymer transporter ExbB [Myxococcales bacterium]|tara:strand:+ start:322 stop:960 length:639 start_codon:yes stop_codon:yes gene_type:complete